MLVTFRETLTDAIRYWEPRRITYNLVLAAVVAAHAAVAWLGPGPVPAITSDAGFRSQWLRLRIVVYLVGIAFAAILAHFYSRSFFWPEP